VQVDVSLSLRRLRFDNNTNFTLIGPQAITLEAPGDDGASILVDNALGNGRQTILSPLMVADALLSGAKPMGFGGVGLGRSARLYRALVATEIAAGAGSYFSLHKDPHLFSLGASARSGEDQEAALPKMEAALFEEVRKLQEEEIPQQELDKAVRQSRAQFIYSGDSVSSQAYMLGFLESIHSADMYETALDKLAAVTPDEVRRVARHYLTDKNRTVGWFIPTEEDDQATENGVVS